jgi:hypothetical protein
MITHHHPLLLMQHARKEVDQKELRMKIRGISTVHSLLHSTPLARSTKKRKKTVLIRE